MKYNHICPNFLLQIILPHFSQYTSHPISHLYLFSNILLFKFIHVLYFDHTLPTPNLLRSSSPPTHLTLCVFVSKTKQKMKIKSKTN